MADQQSVYEKMARLRELKARKKRERSDSPLGNTAFSADMDSDLDQYAPKPPSLEEYTSQPVRYKASDLMALYETQEEPVYHKSTDSYYQKPSSQPYAEPRPTSIPVKAKKTSQQRAEEQETTWYQRALEYFNDNTPSLGKVAGEAAIKAGLGLVAAYFLAKSSGGSSQPPINPYTQPRFYM